MKEKHYKSLNKFYKDKFGCKVFKVSLNSGLSCPNKDGTRGRGGCAFCNGSVGIGDKSMTLLEQFESVKNMLHQKWPKAKYVLFFEANTNTYAPLEVLKGLYEPLLKLENVVGLSISTRCDAIPDDVLAYLQELNERTYLSIELGLQSSHDATLQKINRGHTRDEFTACVKKLRASNIDVVVHIINGLPGETTEMMLETIHYINELDVQGIKFHMLYIEEGSTLAESYKIDRFPLLSREEYIEVLARQIEVLNPNIVIHRLISGPDNKKLIEPLWLIGKFKNLNAINEYFEINDIVAGKNFERKK